MLNAEMIIKRIEDAGNNHFEPRCKSSFMLGIAYGEIRELVRRVNDAEQHPGAFHVNYCGQWLGVDGEYTPETPNTYWEPGEPESFTIRNIYLGNKDITMFFEFNSEVVEELVLELIHKENELARDDAAYIKFLDMSDRIGGQA